MEQKIIWNKKLYETKNYMEQKILRMPKNTCEFFHEVFFITLLYKNGYFAKTKQIKAYLTMGSEN